MKIKLTIIIFLFCLAGYCQDILSQLHGDWVKYRMEMKDGSKLKSSLYKEDTFIRYSFGKKSILLKNDPLNLKTNNTEIPFTLNGNVLKTSKVSGYLIEKISQDTLILADNYNATDDKLIRYYFLKSDRICEFEKSKQQGETYVANVYCTPKLIKTISLESLSREYFNISGRLRLSMTDKQVETIITDSNSNPVFVDELKAILNKTFKYWDTDGFERYKFIEIPFFTRGQKLDKKVIVGGLIAGDKSVELSFLQELPLQLRNLGNKTVSTQLYMEGLLALNGSDTDKAVAKLTESYEKDHSNYEALYARAAINYHIGQKERACEDFKFLSELGQLKGIKLYAQYCGN